MLTLSQFVLVNRMFWRRKRTAKRYWCNAGNGINIHGGRKNVCFPRNHFQYFLINLYAIFEHLLLLSNIFISFVSAFTFLHFILVLPFFLPWPLLYFILILTATVLLFLFQLHDHSCILEISSRIWSDKVIHRHLF